jgi:hypothetical protein
MIKVHARAGLKVPMEGAPGRFIESAAVPVPESPYYQKQIAESDLIIVSDDDEEEQ